MALRTDPLAALKDFQRRTAEYAFSRMYDKADPARRFLIADEVGLGKTIIARGIVSKVIEHLRAQGTPRIDVVYLCSNTEIARQNVARLQITGRDSDAALPDRITMLPLHHRSIDKTGVNFFSFTPGTSLDVKRREGQSRERALLSLLLGEIWSVDFRRRPSALRVFQGEVRTPSVFRNAVRQVRKDTGGDIDPAILAAFAAEIRASDDRARRDGGVALRDAFDQLLERAAGRGAITDDFKADRKAFIGLARRLLAQACVAHLEPDLIILDEFQRFDSILHGEDESSSLARDLFAAVDGTTGLDARVLLLSATPYRAYSTNEELGRRDGAAGEGDEFVRLVDFLFAGLNEPPVGLTHDLAAYRSALYQAHLDGGAAVRAAREVLEGSLRRVMCRTERLAVTPERDGMLAERPLAAMQLVKGDVAQYRAIDFVARDGQLSDPVELWKSSPYLSSFLDGYLVDRRIDAALDARSASPEFVRAVASTSLPLTQIRGYREVDPGNARMRALQADVVDSGLWRLLWLPPSLPYYEPAGAFAQPGVAGATKRLVFSSWTVAPRAIAGMLSYEAERRIMTRSRRDPRNTETGRRQRLRLPFSVAGRRPAGMPVLSLVMPYVWLARECDPLAARRDAGSSAPPRLDEVRAHVAAVLHPKVEELNAGIGDAPLDERWHWALPLALEADYDEIGLMQLLRSKAHWEGDGSLSDPGELFKEHLKRARAAVSGRAADDDADLGRIPTESVEIAIDLAIGGPGVCALRALAREVTELPLNDPLLRQAAARVAWRLSRLM